MSMSFRTINKTNIFFNSLIFLKLQNCFRVNCDFILGILSNEKDSKSGNKEHYERKEKRNRRNTDENEWVSKGELINPIKNVSVENSRIEKFLFFHFFFHPVQGKYYRTRNFWRVNSFLRRKVSYIISILFFVLFRCLIFFYQIYKNILFYLLWPLKQRKRGKILSI